MPTTRDAFFREVMAYRPMLRRAVAGILGEAEATEVFRRLAEMEAVGAYLGDAKVLEDMGAFLKEGAWGENETATDVDGLWMAEDRTGKADPLREVMEEVANRVEQGDEEGIVGLIGGMFQIKDVRIL